MEAELYCACLVGPSEVVGMQITAQHERDISIPESCQQMERRVWSRSVFPDPRSREQRLGSCLSAKDMVGGGVRGILEIQIGV